MVTMIITLNVFTFLYMTLSSLSTGALSCHYLSTSMLKTLSNEEGATITPAFIKHQPCAKYSPKTFKYIKILNSYNILRMWCPPPISQMGKLGHRTLIQLSMFMQACWDYRGRSLSVECTEAWFAMTPAVGPDSGPLHLPTIFFFFFWMLCSLSGWIWKWCWGQWWSRVWVFPCDLPVIPAQP